MPADVLRDREQGETPPSAGTPVPYYLARPGDDFATLASVAAPALPSLESRIAQEFEGRTAAGEVELAAIGKQKAAHETGRQRLEQQQAADREELRAARPAPTVLPEPPSRGLHAFLSPSQGEDPFNTISKLIQGISLMATGFTGLARGDATAALASMKGALAGWQEGDKQRADRHFADWKAKTDKMLEEAAQRHQSWRELFEEKKLSADQQAEMFKASLAGSGYDVEAAKTATANHDAALKFLTNEQHQRDQLQLARDKLVDMAAEKEKDRQMRFELEALKGDRAIELFQMKQDAQVKRDTEAIAAYDDVTLKSLGQQWALTGKMPSIGQGGKGAAVVIRGKVVRAGIEWARENGLDPMSLPSVRMEVQATQGGMNVLARQNATMEASIRRFDGHVDALVELSKKVPRSDMPAINGAILRGEKEYMGSPEAAAYVAQAFEVGMELARVVLPGSAQGDSETRAEARRVIAAAMTHDQLVAVTGQLRQNAHRNFKSNREAMVSQLDILKSVGAGGGAPVKIEPEPTPSRMAPPPGTDPKDPLGLRKKKTP